MLSFITGTVQSVKQQSITVITGPIGLQLQVPSTVTFTEHQQITLYVHMHWNAEQGPALYGFSTELDRTIFLLIISCSGIGPKIALAVLSDLGASAFVQAVQEDDPAKLSTVSGIGHKKAEQMIVQLRHKVEKLRSSGVSLGTSTTTAHWPQVEQVLKSLNYSRPEISGALKQLRSIPDNGQLPFDQLMRKALSYLAKKV